MLHLPREHAAKVRLRATFAPSRQVVARPPNARKTDRGAEQFLTDAVVRAASFALSTNARKTDRGAKQFLADAVVRGAGCVLLALVTVCALAGQVGEPRHVTAVRYWSLGDVTRIAVETDGDFRVRSDRLEDPDRIFFDLSGTKPSLGSKNMTVIPVSDRFVRQIRVAEPQRNTTRVVLDLAGPAEPTLSRLENPSRLIIELRAPGGELRAPGGELRAPGGELRAPGGELRAPGGELRAPGGELRAPGGELRTPTGELRAPASELRAPAVEIRVPSGPDSPRASEKNTASELAPSPKHATHRQFVPPPAPILAAISPRILIEPPPPIVDAQISARASSAAAINAKISPGFLRSSAPAILTSAPAILAKPSVPAAIAPTLLATNAVASANTPVAAPPLGGTLNPATSEVGMPAKRNASGERSMIRVLGLKVGRIVLDPGHGGHDTGTVGPDGLKEKDLVLDVAKRLGALIEERMGSEVIFTRSDDTFVPLEGRTEIANQAKADLFLSIHANSSTLRTAAGVETYYLSFTTSRSALEVAARENSASQKTVYELQDLLEKIALKDKVEESHEFANRVQAALYTVSAKTNVHAKDRGVRKAPFVVLIGASMPSVLAEIGFLSNPHDETTMKASAYRDRLAEALYKGLASYAGTLSHFQVAQRR